MGVCVCDIIKAVSVCVCVCVCGCMCLYGYDIKVMTLSICSMFYMFLLKNRTIYIYQNNGMDHYTMILILT